MATNRLTAHDSLFCLSNTQEAREASVEHELTSQNTPYSGVNSFVWEDIHAQHKTQAANNFHLYVNYTPKLEELSYVGVC